MAIDPSRIAAIIPAAGYSSRYPGGNKLLEKFGVATVLERVVWAVGKAGITKVVVVTGHEREPIEQLLRASVAETVFNPAFDRGMGSSIAAGVRHARTSDGFLIWPGDMPGIKPATARGMISHLSDGHIVVPVLGKKRGHPVLFSASFFADLSTLSSVVGARSILETHPESVVEYETEDEGIFLDVNTDRDLENVRKTLEQAHSNDLGDYQ